MNRFRETFIAQPWFARREKVGYIIGRRLGIVGLWLEEAVCQVLAPASQTRAGSRFFTWCTRMRIEPVVGGLVMLGCVFAIAYHWLLPTLLLAGTLAWLPLSLLSTLHRGSALTVRNIGAGRWKIHLNPRAMAISTDLRLLAQLAATANVRQFVFESPLLADPQFQAALQARLSVVLSAVAGTVTRSRYSSRVLGPISAGMLEALRPYHSLRACRWQTVGQYKLREGTLVLDVTWLPS